MEPIRPAVGAQSRRLLVRRAMAVALLGAVGPGSRTMARAADRKTWRTWLLDAGDALRPTDPGDPTGDERSELLALQTKRIAATAATVAVWGDGPALLP